MISSYNQTETHSVIPSTLKIQIYLYFEWTRVNV